MRFSLLRRAMCLCVLVAPVLYPGVAGADSATTFVRFATPLGNVDVEMLTQQAPKNVANFAAGERAVLGLRLNRPALALLAKNHHRLRVTMSVTPSGAKAHKSTPRLVQRTKR